MEPAYYERVDAQTFVASRATQSPWDARLQHGGPPTALLARAMLAQHPRGGMRLARINAEFLGPIPIARMTVRTRIVRPGKRIEMLEGALEADGREVVSARAWRIAVQSPGSVPPAATSPDTPPPLPSEQAQRDWLQGWGYGESIEWRYATRTLAQGPKAVWTRVRIPLIAGDSLEPLDRALVVVDSANGVSGELPMDKWLFVPPSLSVAIEREPRGEWVLLDARSTLSDDGLGISTARLADEGGYLAAATQALLVERRV
ncbi:acyl-CoA thioesterase [Vulcanimicrobium alpinum]|uniref:Acyl-CoA thioesterase n=1 Tax=Vulcanimicrobium alpinum TaxID=3016050 RepID=A0AAN1XWF8_UNVUL|nr:thioesterase family protein [Vulcanimicrobium alpinum]BDE05542.1 acyl-CoA thioesterase [Vulcanimicrobium alpinum]